MVRTGRGLGEGNPEAKDLRHQGFGRGQHVRPLREVFVRHDLHIAIEFGFLRSSPGPVDSSLKLADDEEDGEVVSVRLASGLGDIDMVHPSTLACKEDHVRSIKIGLASKHHVKLRVFDIVTRTAQRTKRVSWRRPCHRAPLHQLEGCPLPGRWPLCPSNSSVINDFLNHSRLGHFHHISSAKPRSVAPSVGVVTSRFEPAGTSDTSVSSISSVSSESNIFRIGPDISTSVPGCPRQGPRARPPPLTRRGPFPRSETTKHKAFHVNTHNTKGFSQHRVNSTPV